ncbi:MAG: deoxycytidylate deaminase [Candidatus Heimdallarchaeaceae archaeon]
MQNHKKDSMSNTEKRPSWHEYFFKMVELVAERSTSPHRKVGAILVKDSRIIATGYNGTPVGFPHEIDTGCPREELKKKGLIKSGERYELCNEVHAEMNCIIQCAVYGVSCADSVLYCSTMPCKICARALVNARIKAVYVLSDDMGVDGRDILTTANIPIYTKEDLVDKKSIPNTNLNTQKKEKQEK